MLIKTLKRISGLLVENPFRLDAASLLKADVLERDIPTVLIIGKEHCFESTREFPIGSVKEVMKAARLVDDAAPYAGKQYCLINKIDANRSSVTFCTIRQDIIDRYADQSWVIFPESLLVKSYILNVDNEADKSLDATIFGRSIHAHIVGSNYRCHITDSSPKAIGGDEYAELLLSTFAQLPSYALQQSFNSERIAKAFRKFQWRLASAIIVGISISYLLLSSLWLTTQEANLSEQISAQRSELDAVFRLQRDIHSKQKLLLAWQSEPKLQKITLPLWFVLDDLIEKGIEIQSFSYGAEGVVVRAKAKSAADAITLLADNTDISVPESIAPVMRSRGKETFSVRFRLEPRK